MPRHLDHLGHEPALSDQGWYATPPGGTARSANRHDPRIRSSGFAFSSTASPNGKTAGNFLAWLRLPPSAGNRGHATFDPSLARLRQQGERRCDVDSPVAQAVPNRLPAMRKTQPRLASNHCSSLLLSVKDHCWEWLSRGTSVLRSRFWTELRFLTPFPTKRDSLLRNSQLTHRGLRGR